MSIYNMAHVFVAWQAESAHLTHRIIIPALRLSPTPATAPSLAGGVVVKRRDDPAGFPQGVRWRCFSPENQAIRVVDHEIRAKPRRLARRYTAEAVFALVLIARDLQAPPALRFRAALAL